MDDLAQLLSREGLDEVAAEQTLAWARARAAEIVQTLADDPELGPLLSDDGVVATVSTRPSTAPMSAPPSAVPPEPAAELGVAATPALAPEPFDAPEPSDAAAEPSEAAPPADDEGAPVAVIGLPPLGGDEPGLEDTTQPMVVARPASVPVPAAEAPEPSEPAAEDEIELIDDDEIELVEDEPRERDGGNGADEVPEWKAALTSAQLGGDRSADERSGLLPLSGPPDGDDAPAPAADEPAPAVAPTHAPVPVKREDSLDLDLSDL